MFEWFRCLGNISDILFCLRNLLAKFKESLSLLSFRDLAWGRSPIHFVPDRQTDGQTLWHLELLSEPIIIGTYVFEEMFYNISTVNKLSDVVTEIGVLNKENEGLTIELDDIPPIYAKPYFPNIKFEVEIAGLVSQVNASFKIRCSKSKLHTGCPKRKGISVQYISCFYQARNSILTVMPWLICWLSFPCLWAFIIQAFLAPIGA